MATKSKDLRTLLEHAEWIGNIKYREQLLAHEAQKAEQKNALKSQRERLDLERQRLKQDKEALEREFDLKTKAQEEEDKRAWRRLNISGYVLSFVMLVIGSSIVYGIVTGNNDLLDKSIVASVSGLVGFIAGWGTK